MRVGVVGSRGFPRLGLVREFVAGLPGTATVVSGGARGVDQAAEKAAVEADLTVEVLRLDWSQGRGAGLARNSEIVARADCVVAFWDGESRGTMDTVRKARAAGKPVWVIDATRESLFCEMENAWRHIRGATEATTRPAPGDRVVFRDDAGGPVYRVRSVSAGGIARLRHEEGGFDTPPVDVSHLERVDEHLDATEATT